MVRPGAIPSQALGAWAALRCMTRRIKRDPQGRKRQPTTRVKYADAPLPRPAHSRPSLRVVDSDTVFLPGRDRYQTARHSRRQNRWTISRPCPGMLMDSSRSAPTRFSSRNDLFRDRRIASRMPVLWGRVSDAHFRTYGCASRDAEHVPPGARRSAKPIARFRPKCVWSRKPQAQAIRKKGDRNPATRDGVEGAARSSSIYEYLAHRIEAAKATVSRLPIRDGFVAVTITLCINRVDRVLQRVCLETTKPATKSS
jgi:hypothetical protein